ncbi:transglycosylase domain-containing protein [Blautia liquoris]|uniref:Penicillin-binding protein 1A n=1 Tax=Blautia liquoris TaxID=2779518 RepID=A0A7M2RH20_9FIRM|nr:biosynthetic peptidoglycan transglycosylase [Blautia liquoris]QOV19615.1 transglycosylase domain-containing protein [Blautia liquoris]
MLNSSDGNRISVSIDEIPESMQHAIVAIEDSRFYEHNGIDPQGIARAVFVAVKNRGKNMEGASTITQQLLKNNVFTNWVHEGSMERFRRKFQEQYLAVKLESSLNAKGLNAKDIILENYLNTVNFGAGAYGIQTAAQTYFGKNCADLSLSESTALAANAFTKYG